jgi:CheY-like chemotaxis protein
MKKVGTQGEVRSGFLKRKILYVEDNDDNWIVAELRLGKQFELVRASTDREACAMLEKHGETLSGILMDIELLGSALNGIQLTRLLRGKLRPWDVPTFGRDIPPTAVPILFVTAHGQTYSTDHLKEAGGDAVVTKPVDFKVLNMELMRLRVSSLHKVTSDR